VTRKISPAFCHIVLFLAITVIAVQSTGLGPGSAILDVFLTGLYGAVWLYVPVGLIFHFTLLCFLTQSIQESNVSNSNDDRSSV
jgi:hypothetical protein